LLNYLTAARAAQEMGENQLRDDYLREAQQSMPEARIAVELTQAQLQLANQQWEQALATLRHLKDLAPHHPYVLKLLMHLYQEVRDWPQLIALLPTLQKNHIVTGVSFKTFRQYVYLQALNDLIRLAQKDNIHHFINRLPKSLRYDVDLMHCYCQFLLHNNQETLAASILHRCLYQQFSDKLITLYGKINDVNEKQLLFAESLLKKHASSAALYLCLGRLCLVSNLWGKAKTYFTKSITILPQPEAYAELGNLLARFGEHAAASDAFQQGLRLAINTENY
jgi:HemY protein